MSVYGIGSLGVAQMNTRTGRRAAVGDVFENMLDEQMQTGGQSGISYAAPDVMALFGQTDMDAVLLAAMLRQGANAMNMGAALTQLTQNGWLQTRQDSMGGVIPPQAGRPVYPAVKSDFYNRSPELYRRVINQFCVETNPRYAVNKNGTGDTYCNIFVWDVTRAMGAEIPHYYNAQTGAPMECGDSGASEMTANRMYTWLHEHGEEYGWFKVTDEQAQDLANQGRPVVTALSNSGGHGHVQVVCPSHDGYDDPSRGVTIAQAGRTLTSYRPITEIYRASLPKVAYFAHI